MTKNLRKIAFFLILVCTTLFAQAQKNVQYHTVEEGQTLYSIARHYNISPAELMKLNPEAGDLIKPGDKLRIPNGAKAQSVASGPGAQFVGTGSNLTQGGKTKCKQMYQIMKKDNLYRISLNFNITILELLDANPGLTTESKLKKGDWLCIPYSKAELQAEADRVDAVRAVTEATAKKSNKSHLNVAVVLPLKENTDRGSKMIEFYQGLLMAVDSVRKHGTSIDLYAYHSGNSVAELNNILGKSELKHMDVIFGPLDGAQANVLSAFSQQHKIRLVMPFATTNTYGNNNPYAYVASAKTDDINANGASLVAQQFAGYNIVIANAGSTDNRGATFIKLLSQKLSSRGITPSQFDLDAEEITFSSALNLFRNNLIVLNNSSQAAVQKATRKLRSFQKQHPEYKISLMGYPEWSTYQGSVVQDFYALDTYAFAAFFRNPNDSRTSAYERRFKANFHNDMIKTSPRYGVMGMDLGYYFLHGLAQLGDHFDEKQHSLSYNPMQNAFNFKQAGTGKAHVNTWIGLVHYTPLGTIEVIKQK